jgi:hypothetical protein
VGVLLGQRSTAPAPSAAGAGSYPLVVDTRAPAPVALPAAVATRPVEARPAVAETPVARVDAPATIDVQNLPPATKAHAQGWSVPTPATKPAASGWTVAGPLVRPAAAPATAAGTQGPAGDETTPVASAAPAAPEAPAASAAPTVDSFVQAVRDDIREDEGHTK